MTASSGAAAGMVLSDVARGLVERHFRQVTDPVVDAVRDRLAARSSIGIAKYGTTVADNPLSRRQWLQHAQEEALDLAVYLERLIRMEDGL